MITFLICLHFLKPYEANDYIEIRVSVIEGFVALPNEQILNLKIFRNTKTHEAICIFLTPRLSTGSMTLVVHDILDKDKDFSKNFYLIKYFKA